MKRTTIAKGFAVLVAGLLIGGTTVAVATPTDPCEGSYVKPMNSTAKLKAYTDCRADRQDAALKRIEDNLAAASPSPSASPSASQTPSATPSVSPSQTPSPTVTTPTPSGTPTAVPTGAIGADVLGWKIDQHNVGLEPFGLSCATLPKYTGNLRPAAGTVISGRLVEGNLDLRNGDITVEKSCIRPGTGTGSLITNYVCGADECPVISDKTVTIRDSEIDASTVPAQQVAGSCAFRGTGILQRNYAHGMGSGICFYGTGMKHDAIAEQNYVTDMRSYGESHNEAATLRDLMRDQVPTRVARFKNNRFRIMDGNVTAGLFIQPTWDDIDNVTVEGNLIEGGGFNLYLNRAHGTYQDTHAVNNRFNPVNAWGPVAVDPGPEFTEWRDNHRYDPTKPDAKGAVVNQ